MNFTHLIFLYIVIFLSYLHKAIKPVNQLRMIEDSAVIYRIARAPERRIFKIDVGNLQEEKSRYFVLNDENFIFFESGNDSKLLFSMFTSWGQSLRTANAN